MSKMDTGYDLANDPFATTTDEISEYYHVQSTGFGGSSPGITAGSANFPVNTQNRLFVSLPMIIDRSDLDGSRPIKVVDATLGSTMTRVTTSPTGNQYRIPPVSSIRRDVIEISSTKTGNIIDYDYYGEGSVFNAGEFNVFREFYIEQKTVTSDYSILDNDGYRTFICNPNTSDQYGMLTITLPTASDNQGRIINIVYGNGGNSNGGMVKIACEGSENFVYKRNNNSILYFFRKGDTCSVISNGTEWVVVSFNATFSTGFINRNDWSDVYMGMCIVYYNSLTGSFSNGETVVEAAGNTCTGVVISNTTSYLLLYNVTNGGVFTNGNVLNFSNGASAYVNQGTGNNKNIDTYIYHSQDLHISDIQSTIVVSTAITFNNSFVLYPIYSNADAGLTLYENNSNELKIWIGEGGFIVMVAGGNPIQYTATDLYYNILLEYKL